MVGEAQQIKAVIETAMELVSMLNEQVVQRDRRCQLLEEQLACQLKQNVELTAQLMSGKSQARHSVILFPQTPAT